MAKITEAFHEMILKLTVQEYEKTVELYKCQIRTWFQEKFKQLMKAYNVVGIAAKPDLPWAQYNFDIYLNKPCV